MSELHRAPSIAGMGHIGASVWLDDLSEELAVDLEELGFGALWIGPTIAPDLVAMEQILAATKTITVISAITTIWSATPAELAAAYLRIAARHGRRFVLGLGSAHSGHNSPVHSRPVSKMREALDGLDAQGVPKDSRLLAALGPRMTVLAGERTLGAHPYLAPAGLTAEYRSDLGSSALLSMAFIFAASDDSASVLELGRQAVQPYLALENYRRNFLRAGFTLEDLGSGGSERLIRALVGSPESLRSDIEAHLSRGADHVSVGVRVPRGESLAAGYARAAHILDLAPRR